MNKKVALVFGANGQSASYLCELLLSKNYEVHGVIRRASSFNIGRIEHIRHFIKLHYGDMTDYGNILEIISKVKPDEIYNMAAQSHVKVSSELESYTFDVNAKGPMYVLKSVKILDLKCKIYQASTSEMYGNQTDGTTFLNEDSLMIPCSTYGISKYAAFLYCNMYRDSFNMFVVNGILFNHESPNRGPTFVTAKIANYVANFHHKKTNEPLQLGNIDAKRDWGSANDYMQAVYMTMQQDTPKNYVIATGETHSVREFVELAFKEIDLEITWKGIGLNEVGITRDDQIVVQVNPKYFRDIDINVLIGDSSKAYKELGWKPKTSFKELVKEMVDAALVRNK
jgi:GDPmannose 4,6-dehydratase